VRWSDFDAIVYVAPARALRNLQSRDARVASSVQLSWSVGTAGD